MSPTGVFHLIFSLVAVALGALVLLLPKGTRWHRTWGHGYFWSMVGVVGTSFAMFNLTGRVTPFHLAALIAGVTVVAGLWAVLARRPATHWMHAHARWMAWSYIGLVAALVAESLTRFVMPVVEPALDRGSLWPVFWGLVVLGSVGVFVVGGWLVRTRLEGAVRLVRGAAPPPTPSQQAPGF